MCADHDSQPQVQAPSRAQRWALRLGALAAGLPALHWLYHLLAQALSWPCP